MEPKLQKKGRIISLASMSNSAIWPGFCRIDPVDDAHPLVTEGEYQLVMPSGTDGSVSQVRLYDEIIVSGQNLYDGKLL